MYAFSPQTFIDRRQRLRQLDFRWGRQIRRAQKAVKRGAKYLDLLPLFQSHCVRTRFHIYYCHASRLDRCHATRMGNHPNVKLHSHDAGGHVLVQWLRDVGSLDVLLSRTLQEEYDALK